MLLLGCFLSAISLAASCSAATNETDIISGMLTLAGVGKEDVVYDLGYGDGRIVIEAARRFGCRGRGIYCDTRSIRTSIQAARDAGVDGLVSFSSQDVSDVDLSSASVVVLYLLPKDGVRFRPKLLSELRPGTRCISRDFTLGSWRPEGREYLDGSNVYYWIVPANISGVWKWSGTGNQRYSLKIGQVFQDACGYLDSWPVRGRVKSLRISADRIFLVLETEYAAKTRTSFFHGRVSGDRIEGAGEENGRCFAWGAQRVPETAGSIDPDSSKPAAKSPGVIR